VDLKARVALKTDQSVFKKRSNTPKMEASNCFLTTKQDAKTQKQSKAEATTVSDDCILTIT